MPNTKPNMHKFMDEVYKFDVMPYSLQIIPPSTIINISHKATSFLECIDQPELNLGSWDYVTTQHHKLEITYASIVDELHPTYQDSNGVNPPTSRLPPSR
jgi:hypothetical protein